MFDLPSFTDIKIPWHRKREDLVKILKPRWTLTVDSIGQILGFRLRIFPFV